MGSGLPPQNYLTMQNTKFIIKISLIQAIVSVSVARPLSEDRPVQAIDIMGFDPRNTKDHVQESSFSNMRAGEVSHLYDPLRRGSEYRPIQAIEIIGLDIPSIADTKTARKNLHNAKDHVEGASFLRMMAGEVEQFYDALRRSYKINQKSTMKLGLVSRNDPIVNGDLPMF